MSTFLYSRDSKDKIRVMVVTVMKFDSHYEIRRTTGLLGGKLTDQPVVEVHKGKVKRTIKEQAELEFRSIINKQRDKGYKTVVELLSPDGGPPVENIDEWNPDDHELIERLLPKGKTYAGGQRKLMLAKDPKGVSKYYAKDNSFNEKGWNRDWWVSRKLDGIRAAIYYDNGKLVAMSRNGKDLSPAFTNIFKTKKWKSFFAKLPAGCMVDGELYRHGATLQSLSGDSQKNEYVPERHDKLEFWIFDYAEDEHTAEERAILLNSLQGHFDKDNDKIIINSQVKLMSYETIKQIHDEWVKEGFEGAICRDASRLYGFGTRDDRMIKVKEFQDAEFEIVGKKEGLRPEDMCFTCVTEDGQEFECKPMGPVELKLQYLEDMESLVGKFITVKFFNYTPDGIPFLPVGKAIRDYE